MICKFLSNTPKTIYEIPDFKFLSLVHSHATIGEEVSASILKE
jgi:hypothetical protein